MKGSGNGEVGGASKIAKTDEKPAFEMIVLGSGGGPLETDCSGYLVKSFRDSWEDGILALEGGSGLGALTNILTHQSPSALLPTIDFPPEYNSPVLKAAYVFSFLTCYLVTHAHLDHTNSLIMLSGSVPPRASRQTQPPLSDSAATKKSDSGESPSPSALPRPPVYGTRQTLEKLAVAYGGGLWPELGSWAPERGGEYDSGRQKRRRTNGKATAHPKEPDEYTDSGPGVTFTPLQPSRAHRPLHPTLPLTILTYPVVHGCTTEEIYESSAMFIRYDPLAMSAPSTSRKHNDGDPPFEEAGKEFLFFGDVECPWRKSGDAEIHADRAKKSREMNMQIWERAAQSYNNGKLCCLFIECSYDSSRPADLMFGHLSPPGLYNELKTLGSLVSSEPRPLDGLKVYIIHIKDYLQPHPSRKSAQEVIMGELKDLEEQGGLGVVFIEAKQGDRLVI